MHLREDMCPKTVNADLLMTLLDPVGAITKSSGTMASANTFGFSTKQFEPDIGIGYWGHRWYAPNQNRWLSRDPIGQSDGPGEYTFARNNTTGRSDALGLSVCSDTGGWDHPGDPTLCCCDVDEYHPDQGTCCCEEKECQVCSEKSPSTMNEAANTAESKYQRKGKVDGATCKQKVKWATIEYLGAMSWVSCSDAKVLVPESDALPEVRACVQQHEDKHVADCNRYGLTRWCPCATHGSAINASKVSLQCVGPLLAKTTWTEDQRIELECYELLHVTHLNTHTTKFAFYKCKASKWLD